MINLKSLTTAAFASAALVGVAHAATIDVTTGTDTVVVGDTFEVRLDFSADESAEFLFQAIADFTYDADLFSFVGADFVDPATNQNQLDLTDSSGGFDVIEVSDGTLEIDALSADPFDVLLEEQADDFTFVTLTFTADQVGTGDLGLGAFFEFLFANEGDFQTAEFFEADVLNALVAIDVQPVPLPGAAVFLLTGLAGIAARRRMA